MMRFCSELDRTEPHLQYSTWIPADRFCKTHGGFERREVSYRGRCSLGRLTGSVAPLIMQVVVRTLTGQTISVACFLVFADSYSSRQGTMSRSLEGLRPQWQSRFVALLAD